MAGDPARILLWAQVLTNTQLDEAGGAIRSMDAATWIDFRRRLEALDSPEDDDPGTKANPTVAGMLERWR
jgi:hypothetical protein